MGVMHQSAQGDIRVCGQCQKPCDKETHTCNYCGKPVCEACLIVHSIRSRTHDGLIFHHTLCDEKSSAKDFSV